MVMWIYKRDGRREPVAFDKVTARINKLSYGLDPAFIEPAEITQKVVQGIHAGVTTVELDVSEDQSLSLMAESRC